MTSSPTLDIFLVAAPGLEAALRDEAKAKGFARSTAVPGGVTISGGWREVWRANLELRGAGRVIVRLGEFRAQHLSQLDKRAHRFPWRDVLRPGEPFRVEAACKASRIYHSGAAAERVERAIADELAAPCRDEAAVTVRVRIDKDVVTLSVDSSGELLHKRGHKEAVAKAPIRETMAALLLRQCGYDGSEPVLDPMCGSGTFVIEAAEIAANLAPGRSRSFAFERLATFDAAAWQELKTAAAARVVMPALRFIGSDRDAGAIRMSKANAERAGVTAITEFVERPVSEIEPPPGPPGLVIVNPPYGDRIGEIQRLEPLYRAFGATLRARFSGWRVGLVTTETRLAQATGLPFTPPSAPINHGGLRIRLFSSPPLP